MSASALRRQRSARLSHTAKPSLSAAKASTPRERLAFCVNCPRFSPNHGKKMVDPIGLIRNFLSSSNGCELIKNGHRFVNLRKYLCFCLFMQQRILFCSIKTTAISKQLQNAPKKDSNLRPFTHQALCEHQKVSAVFLLLIYLLYHNTL